MTALYECPRCGLRFRFPKDHRGNARRFYECEYEQGVTTTLPTKDELDRLFERGFAGHEKDHGPYIDVLRALGIVPPASILDFGASWGYGSWQLRRAGYEVVAYEIGDQRRRFADETLGIRMIDDPSRPPERVACFFSAHVIEHLADPNEIWVTAMSALASGGLFVAFMPNGDPSREASTSDYHRLWGHVHPLLITPKYLLSAAARYGFESRVYSSPYPLDLIRARRHGTELSGAELAVAAWR